MKKKSLIFIFVIVGIFLLPLSSLKAQIVDIQWNTFLGSYIDVGNGITSDNAGNIYVTGISEATWGSPINPFAGFYDAFVAKLDNDGNLQWNTFLGGEDEDYGYGIILDSAGNIYVTGHSCGSWGSPINPHAGHMGDAFVSKIDTNGTLLWNTFLGGEGTDKGYGIASDDAGNILIAGYSSDTWGSPINPYAGAYDAFVAKLDSNGNLLWNTFLGSISPDEGYGITLDSAGNIYVTGYSYDTWGSPINPHAGGRDVFVTKLDHNGNLLVNTFLGSASGDTGQSIALDSAGNIYVTGDSGASWGSPINPNAGGSDAFIAKLDTNGNLLWNTFLGGEDEDYGAGIVLDSAGNIYVIGDSYASWGGPINPFTGGVDACVSKLDTNGTLLWNTFLGGVNSDAGRSIASDSTGNIYVTGFSWYESWGSPINPFAGYVNAFVAKITQPPQPPKYGYVVAGFNGSFTYGSDDFLVYKLDKDGNKEWRKNYGGTNDDGAHSIRQTSDGGYIVGGYSSSFTYGNEDFLVYKLDKDGNKEWRKNYGGTNADYLSTAIQTTDGGYILYGDTQSFTYGWIDLLVYKLDAVGNKVWRKNYGGTDDDMAFADRWPTGTAICQTTDGGYVFIGTSYSFTHGLSDFIIYKLKTDGSKEWRKNFGGTGDDQGYSIQQTTDGGYILAGFSDIFTYGSDDFLVYKLDAVGNKVWRKNYGGTNLDQCLSVLQTSDGGYVVMGFSYSFSNGSADFLIYKLDASGNKEWRKNFGGTNYERGTSIVQTSDGGYVVAGYSDSFTYGGYDFLLYKLNAAGNKEWRKNFGGTQADQAFCVRKTVD